CAARARGPTPPTPSPYPTLFRSCPEPYGSGGHGTEDGGSSFGEQPVPPRELHELMRRAAAAGLTTAVHAIVDASVTIALDAYAGDRESTRRNSSPVKTADAVVRS